MFIWAYITYYITRHVANSYHLKKGKLREENLFSLFSSLASI